MLIDIFTCLLYNHLMLNAARQLEVFHAFWASMCFRKELVMEKSNSSRIRFAGFKTDSAPEKGTLYLVSDDYAKALAKKGQFTDGLIITAKGPVLDQDGQTIGYRFCLA